MGAMRRQADGWQDWCGRWRDPAVLLAAAGALAAAGMWGTGMAIGEAQLIGRVATLEKRADEQAATQAQAQERTGARAEALDAKLNQLALQMAALPPRLDGMIEMLKTIKEAAAADRARDEAARLREGEWNRRYELLPAPAPARR